MKTYLIPDEARDRIRACVGSEDTMKFKTCWEVHVLWFEFGPGIIHEKSKEEGWKPKEARGKAHRWFLSSLAADAGLGYQSMLNRERVGSSVMARGYHGGENENISYQKWVCLHVNADKGLDGLMLKEILEDRIEWFQQEALKFGGQPPSVEDVKNKYQKDGEIAEWKLLAKKLYNVAKKMKQVADTPNTWRMAIHHVMVAGKKEGFGKKVELD